MSRLMLCSIELAREAGFERLNLDLIYAIPGRIWRPGCNRWSRRSLFRPGTFPVTG